MTIRVLLVDDEPVARRRLRRLLRDDRDVAIAGECGDGASAVSAIRTLEPDLVLLDVQMPEMDGFDVLQTLGAHRLPAIIFVTAFDQYALRAFEVHALDYLLKPIQHERLKAAVERARASTATLVPNATLQYEDYVFLCLGQGSAFVPVSSILAITADGDYTVVNTTEGHEHLVLKPLKQWEARLPQNAFVRIHRSTIVNLRKVRKLESWFNHGYRVFVDGLARPLTMSRRYRHRLSDRFG